VELPPDAAEQIAKYAHEFGQVFFDVFGRKVIDRDPSVLDEG
jgi:hypothetical protein